MKRFLRQLGAVLLLLGITNVADAQTVRKLPPGLQGKIRHIIVIYPENRSQDSLYGSFPGANGLANTVPANTVQVDSAGKPIPVVSLPSTTGIPGVTPGPDERFPVPSLTTPYYNLPYDINAIWIHNQDKLAMRHGDLIHRFYTEQWQINDYGNPFSTNDGRGTGSPNAKFATYSDNPGLVLSHYDASNLGEGQIAQQFVMCDNCFHGAYGGSFLNHQWLVAARAPVWPKEVAIPANYATVFDAKGVAVPGANGLPSDGALTNEPRLPGFPNSNTAQRLRQGDYWAVNTLRPIHGPAGGLSNPDVAVANRLPLQYCDTIGDRLDAAGLSWVWYSGGWNDAKAGKADPLFQYHHQPFAYFSRYALAKAPSNATGKPEDAVPGVDSPGSAAHLKDESADFYPALVNAATFPAVVFVKPIGANNSHPGYAAVQDGQKWVASVMARIQASPVWNDGTVVFITYDEHGGLWDHVVPPHVDAWGPGLRVPLIVASPLCKKNHIDHTMYDTSSILAFIEANYGLAPLNTRDANANIPLDPFNY